MLHIADKRAVEGVFVGELGPPEPLCKQPHHTVKLAPSERGTSGWAPTVKEVVAQGQARAVVNSWLNPFRR